MTRKKRDDPYSSPNPGAHAAMLVFRMAATWTCMFTFAGIFVAWIGSQSFWAWDRELFKFNVFVSVTTMFLEIVLLMAQKSINEFDREIIKHGVQLGEADHKLLLEFKRLLLARQAPGGPDGQSE